VSDVALKDRGSVVESLRRQLAHGSRGLDVIPQLVKHVLLSDAWRRRYDARLKEEVRFERFVDFVTTPPLEGLGTDAATVRKLIGDDTTVRDAYDRAVQGRRTGRPGSKEKVVDNINDLVRRPDGTAKDTALRRLRAQRPDLHARVLADELSPHAAMVEAGFRRRTITLRVDDATSALRALLKHFSRADLLAALEEMR
jgi:hypothetical protein